MSIRVYSVIKWHCETPPIHIEQLQEHSIRTLKQKCPHIAENELEMHYDEPRNDEKDPPDVISQVIWTECEWCSDASAELYM